MENKLHIQVKSVAVNWLLRIGLLICCSISIFISFAQDSLPASVSAAQPITSVEEYAEYNILVTPIPVGDSMPATFKETEENLITDTTHVLVPFFEKLSRQKKPVRVVHIGDSHVRGYAFPLAVRRNLERDFGGQAVYPDTITYFSSGLARETGRPGIVYHAIGINGATCLNFTNAMQVQEIASLKPDLIILSFGTNESHGRGYNVAVHIQQMDNLVKLLQEECPGAALLFTTPPGSYLRYRRRTTINTRTPLVAQTIVEYAGRKGFACWDQYNIVGGRKRACLNWVNTNYFRRDRVHYTEAGYRLQGNLLYEALIKAYNNYVAD